MLAWLICMIIAQINDKQPDSCESVRNRFTWQNANRKQSMAMMGKNNGANAEISIWKGKTWQGTNTNRKMSVWKWHLSRAPNWFRKQSLLFRPTFRSTCRVVSGRVRTKYSKAHVKDEQAEAEETHFLFILRHLGRTRRRRRVSTVILPMTSRSGWERLKMRPTEDEMRVKSPSQVSKSKGVLPRKAPDKEADEAAGERGTDWAWP